jgi:hypothetical protein
MGKGKDKAQRKRRRSTDQENEAKKKKKEEERQKKETNDIATGFHNLFHPTAPVPPESALDDVTPNLDPPQRESDTATAQEEKQDDEEDRSEEIRVPLPTNGTADGGVVIADLDDDSGKEDDAFTNGPMGAYLKAVLLRLREEASTKPKKQATNFDHWLTKELDENGFWLRKERAKLVCRKLKIEFGEPLYYRDIRVWIPEIEGGQLCMPTCTTCKSNLNVRIHSYTTDHPARRIVALSTHYYLMSREYMCKSCQVVHKERKEKANGQPFDKCQYTFMGYHDECLKNLPDEMLYKFPAVLTHRAGVDIDVARLIRPLLDKGTRPDGISKMLLELHALRYTDDYLISELLLSRKLALGVPSKEPPMFSTFADKSKYNERVPTGRYISQVYKKQHDGNRSHMDREMKKVTTDRFHIDGSHKAPKKLCHHKGKPMYDVLQTATNEKGQIRVQCLGTADSHEQLDPALDAMKETQQELGQQQPRLVTTDNPKGDKAYYMEKFESVRKTQRELDRIAGEMNATIPGARAATDPGELLDRVDDESGAHNAFKYEHQVVASQDINSKIEALREQMEETESRKVYGFDIEWVVPWLVGGSATTGKKVALLQLSYRLTDGPICALLLQLPRSHANLPARLVEFLKDPQAMFLGINISGDVKRLAKDYDCPSLIPEMNVLELGTFARKRDIVQNANTSMANLVLIVLGEILDKSEEIRCSNWAKTHLTKEQQEYAALDVIKPLELYDEIIKLPDLSLRLDPESAVPGLAIDIVPGHTPRTGVAELSTRGAMGKILPQQLVLSYSPEISPSRVRSNDETRLVEVSHVLAPSLCVPGYTCNGGSGNRAATLSDFGPPPFRVALPLTMLKVHVDSDTIRTYGQAAVRISTRRITPPSRIRENPIVVETVFDGDDSDSDNDEPGGDEFIDPGPGLFDRFQNNDDEAEGTDPLSFDAGKELLQEHIDLVRATEVAADLAEKEGGRVDHMRCEGLDEPPDLIEDVFSAVLGDPWHGMDRPKVAVKHEYKKPYFYALMNAFFAWDENKLKKVIDVLLKAGWTINQLETMLYFNPDFFRTRVERMILPPRQLYWRVRAVYVRFGDKIDSKTGLPLFNKAAWKKANNLLKEILLGFYSDPPGFDFYTLQLGEDGLPKTDKYGLQLLHCSRGTNDVENIHKHYATMFRYVTGIELGDCLLAERRHRHNQRMAELRIPGFPKLGHYDTWKVDRLQLLVERNHKKRLYSGWNNASSDYRDTDESFVTVALHSEELHLALELKVREIGDKVKKAFSSDQKFLCRAMGVGVTTDLARTP